MTRVNELVSDGYLYNSEYFNQYYIKDEKRAAAYIQEHARLMKYLPNGGRVLDVGCGLGSFLDCFDDRWDKYGVEPSDFAAERAAKKGVTMLRSINVGDYEFFDLVIFRGSLQHIAFPIEAIVQAVRVLKRGGVLAIIATPDTDSLVYSLWHHLPALDAPRNWVVFSSSVLRNILYRLGMSVTIKHPYWRTPYAQPLKDFAKFFISLFLGWRKFAFPGNMCEIYAVKQ